MKPSKLKPGNRLVVSTSLGAKETAYFVRREPAPRPGRKAVNYLRFPGFAGQNGPGDDGTCQMSDYDVSRRVEAAK